jgi:methionyl-tRNA formyltransferase
LINSIILLNNGLYVPHIEGELKAINPSLHLTVLNDLADLIAIPHSVLQASRLISFLSEVIIPISVIDNLGYGAYNFHPGPPMRPGWSPMEMAIYEGDDVFGTTLHEVHQLVDAGAINGINLFALPIDVNAIALDQLITQSLVTLFRQKKAELLADKPLMTLPIPWGYKRSTRASNLAYLTIASDITEEELLIRIRAFGYDEKHKIKFSENKQIFEIENPSSSNGTVDLEDYRLLHGKKFYRRLG